MQRSAETSESTTLGIVCSSTFGRFPKISPETVYNMFIADDFLINFPGYAFILSLLLNGRGIYSSQKANLLFVVSDRSIFLISSDFIPVNVFNMSTDAGDVFIDEDLLGNIAFCDGSNIYIYNWVTKVKYIAGSHVHDLPTVIDPLGFVPNYVCFHDGRFIVTSSSSGGNQIGQWRLSSTSVLNGVTYIVFSSGANFQGAFQTKPDLPIAVARFPGRENQILVMGTNVTEIWSDQGLALFPYQRNQSYNVDFGCLNPATVAELNNLVVWLGVNERSGPTIMYTTGQDVTSISTDGINELLESLNAPEISYGFTYIQAGHMFYVLTFYDPSDNISIVYDFTTKKFYNLSDEGLNFFIAKRTVYFNNKYYFVSIVDGNLYQIDSKLTNYEYDNEIVKQIPRSVIVNTLRTKKSIPKILNDLYFIVEQGIDSKNTGQGNNIKEVILTAGGHSYTTCYALIEGDGNGAYATVTLTSGVVTNVTLVDQGVGYSWAVLTLIGDGSGAFANVTLNVANYVPRVDLSISYDGGYTWSNFDQMQLTKYGNYKNRFYYNDLGYGNEFTLQFRIWCNSRFVCSNGEVSYYG